ncbi:MAG TPA: hypothetical protein VGN55_00710 [Xanthobacteraceae bacterium]
MRAGLQNCGWLLVVAGTFGVYVWGPFWPHAVARYPLWPWLPLFSVTLVLVATLLRRRLSAGSLLLGATVITLFFYFECLIAVLSAEISKGRLFNPRLEVAGYFVVPALNILLNLPVIATFAALGATITMLGRLNKPATIGH